MKVQVLMLAVGRPGEIREVQIEVSPLHWRQDVPENRQNAFITMGVAMEYLDEIFKMGQNDFQPQQHPSVSMGDVVILKTDPDGTGVDEVPFLCVRNGWRRLSLAELACYATISRRDRHLLILDLDMKDTPEGSAESLAIFQREAAIEET